MLNAHLQFSTVEASGDIYIYIYIRHRAFRHRWSELMWEAIPDGHIFDLCRVPPPFAYTRVHSRDLFRFFFVVKK